MATGVAGVCDTNSGTGDVESFSQNTAEDESGTWINGALNQQNSSYAEGDFVPQRVQLKDLAAGENELVFTYDVKKDDTFAYDYVDRERMTGGTITSWGVQDAGGPTATVSVTFTVPPAATAGPRSTSPGTSRPSSTTARARARAASTGRRTTSRWRP